jgi:hypothetical protein
MFHETEWFKHVSKRSDPGGDDSINEAYGDYVYYLRHKDPASK